MKRSRTTSAAHRRLLRELRAPVGIWVQSYPWGLVRLRIRERFELTCTPDELRALALWCAGHLDDAESACLPVDEFRAALWGSEYRWTAAADRQYRRERERIQKRRAAARKR